MEMRRGVGKAEVPAGMDRNRDRRHAGTQPIAGRISKHQHVGGLNMPYNYSHRDVERLVEEIIRLKAEIELWKDRYETERRDHDATIKHCDSSNKRGDL